MTKSRYGIIPTTKRDLGCKPPSVFDGQTIRGITFPDLEPTRPFEFITDDDWIRTKSLLTLPTGRRA